MTAKIIQKSEIIARLGQKLMNIPLEEIKKGVNLLSTHMSQALCENRTIALRGFGTFKLQHHAKRPLFNPKTQKLEYIPPRNVARFKPAQSVSKRLMINSSEIMK